MCVCMCMYVCGGGDIVYVCTTETKHAHMYTCTHHTIATNRVGHEAEDISEHKERCARVQDQLLQAVVEACRVQQRTTSVILLE